jgi:hypothetical protein
MWVFYMLALLAVVPGAILWVKLKEVTWWECLIPTAVCFITAVIFQFVSVWGMTSDIETWSGQLFKATHHPRWVEEYTETETYTDSEGNTQTRLVTKTRTHPEHWTATANYGTMEERYEISKTKFREIASRFGGFVAKRGHKPGRIRGDPNIYVAYNKTGYVYPMNTTMRWENRVKAAPSLFSYSEPPESAPIFEYPKSGHWKSNRLLGRAAGAVSIRKWDMMNSRLGPIKKVNVILVGFGSADSGIAQYQEAKWIGGKKNDLVLCYGDGWSYVFGWTDKEIVKRNLATILLKNKVNDDIIPKIEKEIIANYVIKDWSSFDYIKVDPPGWSYLIFVIVLILVEGGLYAWAILNSFRTREGY